MNNKELILIDKVVGLLLLPCSLLFRAIVLLRRSIGQKHHQPILVIKFLGAGNFLSLKDSLRTLNTHIITSITNKQALEEFQIGQKVYYLNDKNPIFLMLDVIKTLCILLFSNYSQVINLEPESYFAKFLSAIPSSQKTSGVSNTHKGLMDSLIYDSYLVTPSLLNKSEILSLLIEFRVLKNQEFAALIQSIQVKLGPILRENLNHLDRVVIAPTCSSTDSLRRLDLEAWKSIIESLARCKHITALFPNQNDPQYSEFMQLESAFQNLRIEINNYPNFVQRIRDASLMITIDSQALHIAQLANIPTIAFYGPTSPFGVNLGPATYPVTRALACSPCTHKYFEAPCQGQAPCMKFSKVDLEILKKKI
jgi:ADP-heptose:LPS heptosyltransferase